MNVILPPRVPEKNRKTGLFHVWVLKYAVAVMPETADFRTRTGPRPRAG
jgi:hypothetical protein